METSIQDVRIVAADLSTGQAIKQAKRIGRPPGRTYRPAGRRPGRQTRGPSKLQLMEAEEKETVTVTEDIQDAPSEIPVPTITTTVSKTFFLYDREGRPKRIFAKNLRSALDAGLSPNCPICGGEHPPREDENGRLFFDPNACPKQSRLKYTLCPVCDKPIYDDPDLARRPAKRKTTTNEQDHILVQDKTTPEERVASRLAAHMIAYHQTTARARGLLKGEGLNGL